MLAHEMGHVTANHAAQRENKARNALIAREFVDEVLKDDQSKRLALAASQRSLAAFSRQQELEADSIGIRTIGKAGYDPFAAARFLTAMAKYADYGASVAGQDKRPDFLSTHPSTPERVSFAEQAAHQFGAPGVGNVGREGYLDAIDGMIYGDDPAQGFVRERSFIHPGLAIGFTVPPGYVIDNTSDAVLATGTEGTALRFDAVSLSPGTQLTAYLRSGWVNGLVETSVQAITLNGRQAALAVAQAKGWYFQIAVVSAGRGATYRFIFANEGMTDAFRRAMLDTIGSFRTLAASEIADVKPLRVKVVAAATGDTEASLARRMHGVDRARELFDLMNDLAPGARVAPGTLVKIVSDG